MNRYSLRDQQIYVNEKPVRLSHIINILEDNQKEIVRLNDVVDRLIKESDNGEEM